MKFVVRVLHKTFPNTYKFCAIQHGFDYSFSADSTLTVRFGQTSLKDRHIILLNICVFCENWLSEGYNFLWPQTKLLWRLYRETVRYFESKSCELFHARHHLQYCYLEIKSGNWTQYDICFQEINGNKKHLGACWASVIQGVLSF